MKRPEILIAVESEPLRRWLRSVCLPGLVEPGFFERMGFPRWFVRQFLRKHDAVLQLSGKVRQQVRGVNELDFLQGLAEAMGIDSSRVDRNGWACGRVAATARECLRILNQVYGDIDDKEQPRTAAGRESRKDMMENPYSRETANAAER